MARYRTPTEIVADVLSAALDANTEGHGIGITALARRGNLPHSRMTKLVADLVGAGLLLESERERELGKAPRYKISEKGVEFLHTYAQFDEFAQTFGLRL